MTVQAIKKLGVGVSSGVSIRSRKERHRRVIDVVYEADVWNSIESADKLNREIYVVRKKDRVAVLVHGTYLSCQSIIIICWTS